MKQLFHITLLFLILTLMACQKDTFKGSGDYKKNKNQEKTDDYLESEAGKAIEKNKKRNKKDKKKKIKKHKKTQSEEVEKAADSNKKTDKKDKKKVKKKNTGHFNFY